MCISFFRAAPCQPPLSRNRRVVLSQVVPVDAAAICERVCIFLFFLLFFQLLLRCKAMSEVVCVHRERESGVQWAKRSKGADPRKQDGGRGTPFPARARPQYTNKKRSTLCCPSGSVCFSWLAHFSMESRELVARAEEGAKNGAHSEKTSSLRRKQ